MTRLSASAAREDFADALNQVAYGHERIIVFRRKKDLAAIVPLDDLNLLRALEDRIDLEAARKALKEKDSITWEKIKADLGL